MDYFGHEQIKICFIIRHLVHVLNRLPNVTACRVVSERKGVETERRKTLRRTVGTCTKNAQNDLSFCVSC